MNDPHRMFETGNIRAPNHSRNKNVTLPIRVSLKKANLLLQLHFSHTFAPFRFGAAVTTCECICMIILLVSKQYFLCWLFLVFSYYIYIYLAL